MRTPFQMILRSGQSLEHYDFSSAKPKRSFSPVVFVESDEKALAFRLIELAEVFQSKMLCPVIDLCEEYSLFLEEH